MKHPHGTVRNQGLVSVYRHVPTRSSLLPRMRRARVGARRPRWSHWIIVVLGLALLAIAPLLAHAQGADSVTVRWTSPGDDGRVGTASVYELRYSESPINTGNFTAATLVASLPVPQPAGAAEGTVVRGLTRGTPYWFAIRTRDDAGNWSLLSNVTRWDWNLDTAPPAAPSNVAAMREGAAVRVQWSPNAEADLAGYTVYRALAASGPFTAINATLLTSTEFDDDTAPADAPTLWYRVTASDVNGNEGAPSSIFALGPLAAESKAGTIEPGYPNPGRIGDPVSVPVVIPEGNASAVLDVLDSGGRRVRRLDLSNLGPGQRTVVWDGKNDAGASVVPGTYRAWLIVGASRSSIVLSRVP